MKTFRPATAVILAFLLSACGATPTLHLNRDGSGRFDFHLQLEKPFVDYLLDLGEVAGMYESREKAVLFDAAALKKKLEQYPGVKVSGLETSAQGDLSFSLSFQDVTVFTKPGKLWPRGSPLTYTGGRRKSLRLKLNKEILNRILTAFFRFDSTELETFLPRDGESRQEYEENLDFAVDGGADLFRKSRIHFHILVAGTVLKHNGTLTGKNRVTFSVPLESILFLTRPVEYFIEYQ
jgi:hypothetical protein